MPYVWGDRTLEYSALVGDEPVAVNRWSIKFRPGIGSTVNPEIRLLHGIHNTLAELLPDSCPVPNFELTASSDEEGIITGAVTALPKICSDVIPHSIISINPVARSRVIRMNEGLVEPAFLEAQVLHKLFLETAGMLIEARPQLKIGLEVTTLPEAFFACARMINNRDIYALSGTLRYRQQLTVP